jgi:hypothetical protein
LIQEDSRIDQYPRIIKGESKIVLEWQGTTSFLACTHKFVARSGWLTLLFCLYFKKCLCSLSSGNFVVDSTLSSKIRRMQAAEKSRSGDNFSASSMHEEKKERKPIFGVKLFA